MPATKDIKAEQSTPTFAQGPEELTQRSSHVVMYGKSGRWEELDPFAPVIERLGERSFTVTFYQLDYPAISDRVTIDASWTTDPNDPTFDPVRESSSDPIDEDQFVQIGSVEVHGERFRLEANGRGLVLLSHPKWSLSGMGETIIEAEEDLINMAKVVSDVYIESDPEYLTDDAIELREFIIKVLPVNASS